MPSKVDAGTLKEAMRAAAISGESADRDPVCVANGLAYDNQPVNVQLSDADTLAWMDTLVTAGLYTTAVDGESGGAEVQSIRSYHPAAALAAWGDGRRLCAAKAMKLLSVRNVGPVQPMRFRGETYDGVTADVVWTLDEPAPWLAATGVSSTFSNELPRWRGARWEVTPEGWRLAQRKQFFLQDAQWYTGEALERLAGPPPRALRVP